MHCTGRQTKCQLICNSLIAYIGAPRVHTAGWKNKVHGIIRVYMISMMLSSGGMWAVFLQKYNLPCMIEL